MGRPKGSKNKTKQRTDKSAPLVPEKNPTQEVTVRFSKKDGFIHGPCGQFWHIDYAQCPTCHP